jgi:SAM-dependent methyltransferase
LSDVPPNWFETFFETDEWLLLATSLDEERTEREVSFLAGQLPAGGRILDLACGTGRIALPLAARGFDVAGLDISRRALEVARSTAPGLDLRNGDMRSLPWEDETFDGALNLWTAFGYFEDQAEDERVLAEVARVLKPGGVFVLDTVNVTALHRSFRPKSWDEIDGVLFLERRVVDIPTGRAQAYWTFVYPDGRRVDHSFDHRLYPASDYAAMFRRSGLEPTAWYGGFDGSELALDSWRLIVVAAKPA